jgi:Bacterial cell division membrane protein
MFIFSRENTGILAKWWRNVDKEVLFLFIFLFFLGLFFSFSSTSSVVAEKFNKETYFFFLKHFIFVLISLFLLFFISIQNKERIIKSLPILFSISILLLLLVPIIGVEIKGSKRWIDLIYLPRFQPIELVKPLFILLAAKRYC